MYELNGHRTLTYGRRNAFGRARAHVASGENAGMTRGCRFSVQLGDCIRSGPVRMKPRGSRAISSGNQSVRGVAPVKLKTAGVAMCRVSPHVLLSISTPSR